MAVIYFALVFCILLVSISLHEYAHGWAAYKLGDPTAKVQGRLTLNPFAHIDIVGTILMPLLIIFLSQGMLPPLGKAKPVPINPYHLKNPKRDMTLIGAAGPVMNITIAGILAIFLKMTNSIVSEILALGVILNLILAIFNLIPIPPLDGSRILAGFLPPKPYYAFRQLDKFGLFILIPFIFLLLISGFWRKTIIFLQNIVFSL